MFRRILYPTDFSTAAKAELVVVEGIPFQEIVKTAKDKRVSSSSWVRTENMGSWSG